MEIQISDKQIESISDELDSGLRCFYNFRTKEIKSAIDSIDPLDLTDEMEEELAEIEENRDDYFEFQKMGSRSSFQLMEEFVEEIPDERFQNRLINALNKPKPFRNFKYEIDDNGEYRQAWFDFKKQKMIKWVRDQINSFNSSSV